MLNEDQIKSKIESDTKELTEFIKAAEANIKAQSDEIQQKNQELQNYVKAVQQAIDQKNGALVAYKSMIQNEAVTGEAGNAVVKQKKGKK